MPEGAGVLPRTVAALFAQKAAAASASGAGSRTVAVYLSVLEVYNEAVRDLLVDPDPSKGPPKVDLRVTSAGGVTVPGAMELEVPDAATTLEILAIAQENRATAATDVNAHSSRSHLVVTLRLQTTTVSDGSDGAAAVSHSKLQVVDLAGCERVKASHAAGAQLVEATAINKSLSALGDVVGALAGKATPAATQGLSVAAHGSALSSSSSSSFIPYRNSKLTLLLQDALAPHGKAKVVLFVTAAPELNHWNDSLAALTFASRCRAVDLYGGGGGGAVAADKAAAGAAASAAELAAADKKIAELSAQLRRLSA
jgi:kinesin family protein C2/C3